MLHGAPGAVPGREAVRPLCATSALSAGAMSGPTRRQLQVLAYIDRHAKLNAYPPSIREICEHFGWASVNAAASHLRRLSGAGLVERGGGARTLRVTSDGRWALRRAA
jgi:SOS-response transcriptional repressor LexA